MKPLSRISGWFALGLALLSWGAAQAQGLPSVDGQPLSQAQFDFIYRQAMGRGLADTPQLRQAVREEQITRQVLVREANRQGIDREPDVAQQIVWLREAVLIEGLMARHARAEAPSEAELRAEYDRQLAALGPEAREYKVSLLVAATEAGARELQSELRRGAAWDKLARERSIDPSREAGGALGWVLPQTLSPVVANVVVNLIKGAVSAAPIEIPGGWAVVRVEDSRAFQPPGFEASRERLNETLAQRKRQEMIARLRAAAKVQP